MIYGLFFLMIHNTLTLITICKAIDERICSCDIGRDSDDPSRMIGTPNHEQANIISGTDRICRGRCTARTGSARTRPPHTSIHNWQTQQTDNKTKQSDCENVALQKPKIGTDCRSRRRIIHADDKLVYWRLRTQAWRLNTRSRCCQSRCSRDWGMVATC